MRRATAIVFRRTGTGRLPRPVGSSARFRPGAMAEVAGRVTDGADGPVHRLRAPIGRTRKPERSAAFQRCLMSGFRSAMRRGQQSIGTGVDHASPHSVRLRRRHAMLRPFGSMNVCRSQEGCLASVHSAAMLDAHAGRPATGCAGTRRHTCFGRYAGGGARAPPCRPWPRSGQWQRHRGHRPWVRA